MKILALDTSGLAASVALLDEDQVIADYTITYQKTHSQTMIPMLDQIKNQVELDLESIDAVAVAKGPGSFTGLRIGSATAKGLGFALNKPLLEIPTLEGLAYNLYGSKQLVCPIMDARRNQVYTGIYQFLNETAIGEVRLSCVFPQCAIELGKLVEKINELGKEVVFLGDGVCVYRKEILEKSKIPVSFAPAHLSLQKAASIAVLAKQYWNEGKIVSAKEHKPEYLRESQAERERKAALEKETPEHAAQENTVVIRALRKEDAEALAGLASSCFSQPWRKEDFAKLVDDSDCLTLVACHEGKIVGCAGFRNVSGDVEVNNVMTEEAYRRQGIAKRLLTQLLEKSEKLGWSRFTLEVRSSNAGAISLYQGLGFVGVGVRPGFYEKPREDALIMWKTKADHTDITSP